MKQSFERDHYRPEEEKKSAPEMKFFFSAHGTPEDYKGIEDAFKKADIFVVEAHAWNAEDLDHLRLISSGERSPKHIQEGRKAESVLEYEEELLYESGKRVEIVDIPEEHELANEDDGNSQFSSAAEIYVAQGDLPDALATLQEAAKTNADYIRKKDEFIESRLESLLESLAEVSDDAKVLVQMGSTHTGISHSLRKRGEAERVKNEVKFDFTDQLVRSYRFEKKPSRELEVKVLAEQLIKRFFVNELLQIPYLSRNSFFREKIKSLTEEQLQQMGKLMEARYFEEVVMGGKDDSIEQNKMFFVQAWETVLGSNLDSMIVDLLSENKN